MRAWLLLLAVLATFKPIVQVASTEETASTTFLKAITPQKEHLYKIVNNVGAVSGSGGGAGDSGDSGDIEIELITTTSTAKTLLSASTQTKINKNTSSKSTALVKAFNLKTTIRTTTAAALTKTTFVDMTTEKFSKFQKENSDNGLIMVKSLSKTKETVSKVNHNDDNNEEQRNRAHQQHHSQHHGHHPHHHHQHHHHHHHHHHHQPQQQQLNKQNNHSVEQQQDSETTTASTTTTTTELTSAESSKSTIDSTLNISIQKSDISSPTSSTSTSSSSALTTPTASSAASASNADIVQIDEEPATYSNKELIKEKAKPDPEVLVEIENSLLSLFNMKRPPKIDRSKIIIPEAMKKLYEEIMNQELISVNLPKPGLLTKSANTVRSFTHQDSKIDHRFPHHHRFRLYFDIKSIPTKEKLKAAEVQLARDAISHAVLKPEHANRTIYQVLAYDITRLGIRGKREPSYLLLDNKSVRLNGTDTISLDVQPAVERWLASPKQNYGLLIEVRTLRSLKPAPHHHVRLRRSADETHDEWQHKQPLLFTYTDDGRHKARSIRDVSTRSKRAEHHQHRRGRRRKTNEDCRRHSLYVDFADVGWSDWIVAPPGYDAYYCHGKCPFGLFEHLNTTNHAVVQTLVNNLDPAKVPKPCCVPTQLDGMSMLYLNDQNTVVLKNYQDMTVVGCGCR